jgi:hypothetical protein
MNASKKIKLGSGVERQEVVLDRWEGGSEKFSPVGDISLD